MYRTHLSSSRPETLDLVAATLLGRTSRLTRLLMRSGSRELSRTEAGLLTTLADGPRRITELAETEALAQPSISKLVDKLEARDLVTRERAEDDGRVVVVSISAEGLLRLEAARSQIRSLLRRTLFALEDEELAALVTAGEVLERLIQTLQRDARASSQ
jgi:DNA-binding MarR family transcriptional regulator